MKRTIYYDAHCVLCNRVIRYLLDRRRDAFAYVALDPEDPAQKDFERIDSIVYLRGADVFYESQAVLRILRDMGGAYALLSVVGRILPKGITDRIYRAVSTRRYVLWGKMDACPLPDYDDTPAVTEDL